MNVGSRGGHIPLHTNVWAKKNLPFSLDEVECLNASLDPETYQDVIRYSREYDE